MATSRGVVGKLADKQRARAIKLKLGTFKRWDEHDLNEVAQTKITEPRKYRALRASETPKPGTVKGWGKWRHYA